MKYEEWADSIKFIGLDRKIGKNIWETCKQECLKILNRPIQNCDLSWEEVDERFIDRIEKDV